MTTEHQHVIGGGFHGGSDMSDSFIFGPGFIVDLEELAVLLEYISHDEHRWEAVSDDTGLWGDDRCVIIRYSNPSGTDIPNEISFRFRCLSYVYPFSPIWLVCLHSSLAEPVRGGLYFDGEDLKGDFLEDWTRFWHPLRTALVALGG
jgi:hypothetical protein